MPREHFASHQDKSAMPQGDAYFLDEDGSPFYEPSANKALIHWLSTGTATNKELKLHWFPKLRQVRARFKRHIDDSF